MTPETLPADPAGEASRLLWELRHVPDSDGSSEYPWFNYWPDGEHLLPPATWAACNELIARGQVDFCKGVAFRGTGAVAPPPGYSQRLKLANFWYERQEGISAERDALRDLIFDLRLRAEKAEAELARAKAELADLKAERKAEHKDNLQRAIIATLETMSTMWPKGEAPSSRLWQAIVDRGHVAVVRPGQAAEGESHRFYRAKMALVKAGRLRESRGFCSLVPDGAAAPTKECEPTFMD
jgi:hypothetical protein